MMEQQEEWFRKEAGSRIDALEAALNAFALYQIDTLIVLRRQIERIASETSALGLMELSDLARQAYAAGALDARGQAEKLLSLLRAETRARKAPGDVPAESRDPESGLLSRTAFTEMFSREIASPRARAALAAVRISNLDSVRRRYGDETARAYFVHAGRALARLVRDADQIARFTDDEFLIFLPGEDARGLQLALERLEAAIGNHPFLLPDGLEERPVLSVSGCPFGEATSPVDVQKSVSLRVGVLSRSAATTQALCVLLRKEGFDVVASSEEGPAKFAVFIDQRLDLIVVEASKDGLDGTLDGLRSVLAGRRTPLVAVVDSPADGRHALTRGAADFLVKPLQLPDFVGMAGRLARRGSSKPTAQDAQGGGDILIVSNDLYQLIATGTALQKQLGCGVRLGRGWKDACLSLEQRRPGGAILDLRLAKVGTKQLLNALSQDGEVVPVVLVVDPSEQRLADAITTPPVRAVLQRPLDLIAFPTEIQRAFPALAALAGSDRTLQREIVRAVQTGTPPTD